MSDVLAALGGEDGCRRLAEAFYRRVEGEPELRAMYGRSLRCPVRSLASFLLRLLGGETAWPARPPVAFHRRFRVDARAREVWLACMSGATREVVSDEKARAALDRFFVGVAGQLVNTGPPEPNDYGAASGCPLERGWARILAVEAARAGDPSVLSAEPPLDHLLLPAAEGGHLDLIARLVERGTRADGVTVSGELLVAREAAALLLLAHGASVDGDGREPPLIRSCRADRRARPEEVRALLRHGARVDARGRDGRTALHYALRAGNPEVIALLLAAGAQP